MVIAASLLDTAMLQRVTAAAAAAADTWEQIFGCVEGFSTVYRGGGNRELYCALVRVGEVMDAVAGAIALDQQTSVKLHTRMTLG
eukprot:1605828-Rhodomonas_salina.3